MPIPELEKFILPFIQILGDGKEHQRGEIRDTLVQHFGITPDEEKQRSSNTTKLVNLIAWCDGIFCKAGFVTKSKPFGRKDRMQDVFQITPLGMQELNKNPSQITIAYVRTFWPESK